MTLLDDLRALDLSSLADARAGISASVSTEGVQAVVDGGAVLSALGDVGPAVEALRAALEDPEALFAPLAERLLAVAGDLDGLLGAGAAPLQAYLQAVTEGVERVAALAAEVGDDPLALLRVAGRTLPGALEELPQRVADLAGRSTEDVGVLAAVVARVDTAGTVDPEGLLDLALEVLSPFPRHPLDSLRSRVDALLAATAAVALPETRTQGLVVRLDAVAVAAATGDARAVARAVAELDRVRVQTVDVLRADLAVVAGAVARLPVTEVAEAVATAHGVLTSTRDGVLDTLTTWRAQLVRLRAVIEAADGEQVATMLRAGVDHVEAFLRAHVVAGVDAQVDRAVERVRLLLAELPLRPLRAEVSAAIGAAARAVGEAGLDEPARAVRATVSDVTDALAGADLADRVRAALEDVAATLSGAVAGVADALRAVASAVDGVQDQAEAVLLPAAEAVRGFGAAVAEVRAAVEGLDLQAAAQQVVDRVREIRTAVETVLAGVPLPEPVRPVVEGLVEQLEALDLDAVRLEDVPVLAPVLEAARAFAVDGDLTRTLEEGLAAVRDAVEGLVPERLVASLDAQVREALDVIGQFDPATLLTGVTALVDEAADAVAGVDLTAAVAPAQAPFTALLDLWDRARPSTLLEPVAQAYDEALRRVRLPGTEELVRGLATSLDATGNAIGAAVTAPLAGLAPAGTTVAQPAGPGAGAAGTPAPAGAGPAAPVAPDAGVAGGTDPTDARPGDVVRLLGHLPGRLRTALLALDAEVLGDLLAGVDRLTAGLARDLRTAAGAVGRAEQALDASLASVLAPVGQAQARAQLAVRVSVDGGAALDLEATLGVLAACGSGSLRVAVGQQQAVVTERLRTAAVRQATVSAQLLRTADALERCALSGLVSDADALLAALDPEPLAAEVDELARVVVRRAPDLLTGVAAEVQAALARFRAVLAELGPGAQAVKFEGVVAALKQELDLLDPRRLGRELDEVHAAVRRSLEAYDPAVLAADVEGLLATAAAELRALDPAALLGDLSPFDDVLAAAAAADPATALAELSEQMAALGDAFDGIDLPGLLAEVAALPEEVVAAFTRVLQGVREEVRALLESLRYATGSVSVTASRGGAT